MGRLISFLLIASFVWASCKPTKNFFEDRERGWFWKEVCTQEVKKKEKKEKKLPKKVIIPWSKLNDMSPDEIKKLVKEAESIAIMHPTYENVREYKRLLLWIANKAREYAKVDYLVSMTDPEIASWLAERPYTPYARRAYFKAKEKKVDEILRKYKDKAGLVIFKKEGCPYCERQKFVIKLFKQKYHWEVKWVDVYEAPNAVEKLQVNSVPDIFLVLNKNGKPVWQRIATGLQTLDKLKKQIVWGLYVLGEVKDEELF